MTEKTPDQLMDEAKALRADADAVEAAAIRLALGLVAGNVRQASALLGVSTGFLSQAIRPGRRHAPLAKLVNRRKGRPPENVDTVAREANRLPKDLAALMPTGNGKGKKLAKPAAKAKPPKAAKKEEPMVKRTDAEWRSLVTAWLDAKAGGANQKEWAAKHKVGVSTLRERTSTFLAGTAKQPAELPQLPPDA